MHGLQLPKRPTQPLPPLVSTSTSTSNDASPPVPSSSSTSPRLYFRPQPPPNFAQQQRTRARLLRGEKKSPFVPKKTQQQSTSSSSSSQLSTNNRGKERDLDACTVEQLRDMFEKNQRLLDSPDTFVNLPGGDSRLRLQQSKVESKLNQLVKMEELKLGLDSTHLHRRLDEEDEDEDEDVDEAEKIKVEDDAGLDREDEREQVSVLDEASSPQTKRRIAARLQSSNPHSMSLEESLKLQRRAVERDRIATERRRVKMELDEKRPQRVGNLLKGALGGTNPNLASFMFGGGDDNSDEEDELDEAEIQDWLNAGKTGVNGELNDEENEQLNPLKTAYMQGWNRALAEEEGASGGA